MSDDIKQVDETDDEWERFIEESNAAMHAAAEASGEIATAAWFAANDSAIAEDEEDVVPTQRQERDAAAWTCRRYEQHLAHTRATIEQWVAEHPRQEIPKSLTWRFRHYERCLAFARSRLADLEQAVQALGEEE